MFNTTVKNLLNDALEERTDLFLIDLTIGLNNAINIVIDGDKGVTVEDCIFVSRAVEHNLDREEEDFSIEVASAGAAALLKLPRQYKKNVGRKLEVKTGAETIEADLVEANDENINLEWKTREPKPIGKGKITVQKKATINYNEIIEAKVMIKF